MFGKGVYCADCPIKGASYTKGCEKIIVAKVFLGKQLTVIKSDKTLNQEKLRAKGFDSVFSPGGNKHIGGCRVSEYVIYDPAKITPAYVVEFFQQPPAPE